MSACVHACVRACAHSCVHSYYILRIHSYMYVSTHISERSRLSVSPLFLGCSGVVKYVSILPFSGFWARLGRACMRIRTPDAWKRGCILNACMDVCTHARMHNGRVSTFVGKGEGIHSSFFPPLSLSIPGGRRREFGIWGW